MTTCPTCRDGRAQIRAGCPVCSGRGYLWPFQEPFFQPDAETLALAGAALEAMDAAKNEDPQEWAARMARLFVGVD